MKKLTTILTAFVFLITVSSASLQAQTRDVGSFDGVSVSGNISAMLVKAESPSIKIQMVKGDAEDVESFVKAGTLKLKIKSKWGMYNNKTKAKIIVYYTDLESTDLTLGSSSGANIRVEVASEIVSGETSSGATMRIAGMTDKVSLQSSSGASINAKELISRVVKASVSSGANIRCHATEKIKANASSGGSIKYNGDPETRDINRSSGGSVNKN